MGQTNFLQSLGWAILNSLWQLALLWVVYQVITGLSKKAGPTFKSTTATTLLFCGFGWFVFTFLSTYLVKDNAGSVQSSVFVNPAANESVNEWLQKTLPIASVVYLVLLVFPFMQFIRNYRYVQVIRKFGLTKIDVSWRLFVSRVASRMNIKKKVTIWVSEFVSSPVTIGFLKPVILVPLAAINHLSPQQLEAVLLHELSHIRRHDYLINLFVNIIQSILYFNPFVRAFVKIIEREREKSCDEMVLQFQYNAYDYASALLTLEQSNQNSKPLAMSASGKKNDLLHRIEMIMGINKKPVFRFQKLAGFMAALLCVIAVQALLLFVNETNGKSIAAFPEKASISLVKGVHAVYNSEDRSSNDISEQPISVKSVARLSKLPVAPVFTAPSSLINNDFIQAGFDFANAVELNEKQAEQIEIAMEASKKILENMQWKIVEKNIAEVFNQKEKEVLKATYDKQVKKIDWKKWENKLKLAYNNIDWEKVNVQLYQAVNEVRLDSITTVYNKALAKMEDMKQELTENNMKGIPDSDINLKDLEIKKNEVRKALNEIRATRTKKIVHL